MNELTSSEDWNGCIAESRERPVLVFKHSTRCPISAMADSVVRRYEAGDGTGRPPLYVVKVVESRPVSDEIARTLDVQHKSPQLILVKNGEAVWSTSHYNITAENIREAVGQFQSQNAAGG
jgi:bacillithiol system protein YtxJ